MEHYRDEATEAMLGEMIAEGTDVVASFFIDLLIFLFLTPRPSRSTQTPEDTQTLEKTMSVSYPLPPCPYPIDKLP